MLSDVLKDNMYLEKSLIKGDQNIKIELEELIAGKSINKQIDDTIVMAEVSLWASTLIDNCELCIDNCKIYRWSEKTKRSNGIIIKKTGLSFYSERHNLKKFFV